MNYQKTGSQMALPIRCGGEGINFRTDKENADHYLKAFVERPGVGKYWFHLIKQNRINWKNKDWKSIADLLTIAADVLDEVSS